MNTRYRGGFFPPAPPKKPPPAHGIKVKKAGTTWWGQRWIEALEKVLGGDRGRLSRGRTYARAGRTHDLTVKGGRVTAKVTGSRAAPYAIKIALAPLDDGCWARAIAGMAAKAQFAAELLAGQMPQAIDDVFRAAGTSLFPIGRADLVTSCSCPDWGDPCKHVAATHYVLGEALDRDPFLLFELRGRSRDQVLGALRAARGGDVGEGGGDLDEPEIAAVTLGQLTARDYERPREALPALQFSFGAPKAHGALLRQLGAPPSWSGQTSPFDALAPLVRAAAEKARVLALAEADREGADTERDDPRANTTAAVDPPARAPARAPITPRKRRARRPTSAD